MKSEERIFCLQGRNSINSNTKTCHGNKQKSTPKPQQQTPFTPSHHKKKKKQSGKIPLI